MDDSQLLRYYLAASQQLPQYCKKAKWDGYCYDCSHEYIYGADCFECADFDLDREKLKQEIMDDYQYYLKSRTLWETQKGRK